MSTFVLEPEKRVETVQMDGLALLKIVKHCHESLPQMVTGSLLGLVVGSILEITHAFPFPTEEDDDFQLEMMRMLREVNVDNNCVGWYQSMYLGSYSTQSFLENQLSYQTDLSENAVVMLYDPMQTSKGNLVLKCFRLSDEYLVKKDQATNIFEELPIKLTNPGLCQALLTDLACPEETNFDRLDLSTNPYLEKHLEFLCTWVDDLREEQHKFSGMARRNKKGNATGDEEQQQRPRIESLLIRNQIHTYCQQMDKFAQGGFAKTYLMEGLQKTSGQS